MSTRLTCVDCRQPIPHGQAHIRTRSFRQHALCGHCRTMRIIAAVYERTPPRQH